MARRRTNRPSAAQRVRAGDLLLAAVRKIVPPDLLDLTRVRAAWPELTRGGLHKVAWPAALRDGTLWVHVIDNQWLHEISYIRRDLLQQIRRRCPEARVEDVRLRVGEVHVPDAFVPPPEPTPTPALPDEPSRETFDALSAIEDPELRQIIANTRMALSKRLRR